MANCSVRHLQRVLTATSVAVVSVLASTTPSRAVDWTGTISTDWFDVGNWSAGVPTNATGTRIDTVTPNATVIGAAGAQATSLRVGVSGTGTLTIQNGGTVSSALGIIAVNAGSTGAVTVDGAGSSWTNSGSLYVGSGGSGTLTIRNGGAVSNGGGSYLGNRFGLDRRRDGGRRRLDLDHQRQSRDRRPTAAAR